MTLLSPTMIVTRLVVERNGKAVYDEQYHEGVNIIRGENSSGKSSILNFIYYGLGGDLTDWSDTALLCSRVFVEVKLNGKTATLARSVSAERGQPMDIFGSDFESSRSAGPEKWLRYPYAISQSRESFSQALFRLLEIPEAAGTDSSNITMHQVLRLLYADQLSPVESIFKFERFDPPTLRDSIGRLLCGAYDGELYGNELKIRTLQKKFDEISAELSSLINVAGQIAGQTSHPLTPEWLAAERQSLDRERLSLQEQITLAEQELFISTKANELSLKAQRDAYADVQAAQSELQSARQKRDALSLTIADSAAFISSLESKILALNDTSLVAKHIGDVHFDACPSCFAPIDATDDVNACHLCKAPFASEHAQTRIAALINDTAVQLRQSKLLQNERVAKVSKLESDVGKAQQRWQDAATRLSQLRSLPTSEKAETLRTLNRQAGYLDRKRENLEETARIVSLIDELSIQKLNLNTAISRLRDRNEVLRVSQRDRLTRAYVAIENEIKALLRNDLRRQDAFENPNRVEFDFASNHISVDGQTYFSASSRVILKSSFFLGFLAAATKNAFFRHPRFCIIDTIEDKGMEPQRSHNFQHQITQVSSESLVDHQIIFATAMISPDLEDDRYTVGRFYTRDEPTLDIRT